MNILEFATKVFDAWAWPITVLALVHTFRDELKAILANIETFKAGGFEASVNRKIRTASEIADELPPALEEPDVVQPDFDEAVEHPEYAILEAWKELEHFARELISAKGISTSARVYTNALVAAGLSKAEVDLFRELQQVRNLVVHERDVKVSATKAKEYVDLAYRLTGLIRLRTDAVLNERAAAA